MKKKIIFLISFIILCTSAYGQVRGGVHAGLGFSDVTSKTRHSGDVSYSAGVLGEYKLQNGVVFSGQLNYVRKGASIKSPETKQWNGIINHYEFHLNYIELPISVGYVFHLNQGWNLIPKVGIYGAYGISGYGFLTSENLKTDLDPNTIRVNPFKGEQGKMPAQDAIYSFDSFQRPNLGAVLGLDVDVSRHIRISLDAKISIGYPLAYYSDAGNVHLNTIGCSVGYLF